MDLYIKIESSINLSMIRSPKYLIRDILYV